MSTSPSRPPADVPHRGHDAALRPFVNVHEPLGSWAELRDAA
ncbi:MAG: hypothetical protein ABIX12_12885 [Rubrivivax sp.]